VWLIELAAVKCQESNEVMPVKTGAWWNNSPARVESRKRKGRRAFSA